MLMTQLSHCSVSPKPICAAQGLVWQDLNVELVDLPGEEEIMCVEHLTILRHFPAMFGLFERAERGLCACIRRQVQLGSMETNHCS